MSCSALRDESGYRLKCHGAASVATRSHSTRPAAATAIVPPRQYPISAAGSPMLRSKGSSKVSRWPATSRSERCFASPQSSNRARRPICATAATSETSASRSRIRGGLISDGMRTAGAPSPPWSRRHAPAKRATSGIGAARDRRSAASYALSPLSASRASSGSFSETRRTNSRNSGSGRGARSCCSALCCGSRPGAFRERFMTKSAGKVTIKKYANRRLYDTESSTYITLDRLAQMVREGREFEVLDAKSGEDITRQVLTQIIVDEEARGGSTMLPINFLKQLIGLYGNSMQNFVPQYLEAAMDSFQRNQTAVRDAFAGNMFADLTKRNMAMFEDAGRVFGAKTKPDEKPSE